jgi:type 1 glutamine amidotransferase
MPKALIVWGGWEGHQPREQAAVVAALLGAEGFDTIATADYAAMGAPNIGTMDLVVPIITNDVIDKPVVERLSAAVREGLGLAGPHAALATSFRQSVEFQYLCGVQWVAHPGNIIDFRVEITKPDDPIMRGVPDFAYHSEQYYLHYDPSVEVLATTRFSGEHDPVTAGVVMPVVFKRRFGAGRVFYTALGHTPEELALPEASTILRRGLLWAARTR